MLYDELYTLFDKKGWIHSMDREDYGLDVETDNINETQKINEPELITSKPIPESIPLKPVSKKIPPPVPPKPDHLKASVESSNSNSKELANKEEVLQPQEPAPTNLTVSNNEILVTSIKQEHPSGTSKEIPEVSPPSKDTPEVKTESKKR